jgi:preprotein translocase subunit SecE
VARNRKRAHDDRADTAAPLEHASAEVELAEAQLAVGRPELGAEPLDDAGLEAAEQEQERIDESSGAPAKRSGRAGSPREGNRLATFLRGSWRELQRVQWPDRRQVVQATGVVVGFVIVAGAYLGLADFVAGKIVDLILK